MAARCDKFTRLRYRDRHVPGADNVGMHPHSSPLAHPGSARPRQEPAPARACGRRARHTRRYVATLIHLANAMDHNALDRLQNHARKHPRGTTLGLNALAQTLTAPVRRGLHDMA